MISVSKSVTESFIENLERLRLRNHFKLVESILRNRDTSLLPLYLKNARYHNLDQLHAYAKRGRFPRNESQISYTPCFIDHDGHECAVAHLVMSSGNIELANNVATVANYAYVSEMDFPQLDEWSKNSGLTKEELALIQPGYYLTFSGTLVSLAIALWTGGVFVILVNLRQKMHKRYEVIKPVMGLIVTTALFLFGIYCLLFSNEAYSLSIHADVPQKIASLAGKASIPLMLAGLISLLLAFFTRRLSIRNLREFRQLRNESK